MTALEHQEAHAAGGETEPAHESAQHWHRHQRVRRIDAEEVLHDARVDGRYEAQTEAVRDHAVQASPGG